MVKKGGKHIASYNRFRSLPRLRHHTFVVPRPDVIQCALEVPLGAFEARIGLVLVCLQVRVDELDEAV